jgi:hypothetical protein
MLVGELTLAPGKGNLYSTTWRRFRDLWSATIDMPTRNPRLIADYDSKVNDDPDWSYFRNHSCASRKGLQAPHCTTPTTRFMR